MSLLYLFGRGSWMKIGNDSEVNQENAKKKKCTAKKTIREGGTAEINKKLKGSFFFYGRKGALKGRSAIDK